MISTFIIVLNDDQEEDVSGNKHINVRTVIQQRNPDTIYQRNRVLKVQQFLFFFLLWTWFNMIRDIVSKGLIHLIINLTLNTFKWHKYCSYNNHIIHSLRLTSSIKIKLCSFPSVYWIELTRKLASILNVIEVPQLCIKCVIHVFLCCNIDFWLCCWPYLSPAVCNRKEDVEKNRGAIINGMLCPWGRAFFR